MDSKSNQIPGRGGAALTIIEEDPTSLTILLVYGASRVQQFDDMWLVKIDKQSCAVTSTTRVDIKELEGFTTRNSMTSVYDKANERVVFFGGMDSEKDQLFNDIYSIETKTHKITHHDYKDGQIQPVVRNSHTMTLSGDVAYVFAGANQDGPRKDLYKLDLKTLEFSNVKLDESKTVLPYLEMHTCHVYQGKYLLILGGRGMYPGQSPEEVQTQNIIYSIDLESGLVSEFGKLPTSLASHQSALIDDKYIVMYGGIGVGKIFDSVIRYSIEEKKWTLMTKYHVASKKSRFFQDGRIGCSCVSSGDMVVFFGGSSIEKENNDWLIIPVSHLKDDNNFSEINEIM